jgi:hypothetical protein
MDIDFEFDGEDDQLSFGLEDEQPYTAEDA